MFTLHSPCTYSLSRSCGTKVVYICEKSKWVYGYFLGEGYTGEQFAQDVSVDAEGV